MSEVELHDGDRVTATEYRALREAVGWRAVDASDGELQEALDRTWSVTARGRDGDLIGLVRMLDDGVLYASVWDMIVAPDLQRRGVGSALFDRVLERTQRRHLVALVATAAGAPLYRAAGFSEESLGSVALFLRPGGR
ncbi:MAG: GNAT family N-acetyltransferase [Actinobacteria bacterium]|nr:GNAT family N-acetyltransferase [Actinomycetota bacterium]